MAGAEGFEPPKAVLETAGLPLAYAPSDLTLIRLADGTVARGCPSAPGSALLNPIWFPCAVGACGKTDRIS